MPAPGARSDDAASLVSRIAAGDRDAFGRFYDAFAGAAFGLIRRIVRDRSAAEEVLQDVFWQVWREAGQYDPQRGTPGAWLLTRARTRAIDRLRSMRRRDKTFVLSADEPGPGAARGADDPGRAVDRRAVEGALAQLPPAQRRVIELAFFEGLTQAEIAARL